MFLKRLIKSENALGGSKPDAKAATGGPPPGMQAMGANLQSKFARGVNYNMKIIIKGDRNVGKTCLHLRLQGKKFREEYLPTDEIQVASIQWSFKTSDDIIKVEIWDVVDKGRKRKLDGLKLCTSLPQLPEETCLDAEFVDVFKGTQGVIMMFDITKQWTFDYVEKELPKVPPAIPVLVLANHRDMGHHRTVTQEQVRGLVETAQQSREGPIKFAEASMFNGYGLKYIHKFFSLPFLYLQKMTLLVQLEKNFEDTEVTIQELDLLEGTEDQNYEVFSDVINAKRREQQEKLAEKAIEDARQQQQQLLASQSSKINGKGGINNGFSMAKSSSFSVSLPPLREAPAPLPIPGSLNLQPQQQNSSKKPTEAHPNPTAQVPAPTKSAPTTPCQGASEVESSSGGFLGKFLSSARKSKKQEAVVQNVIPVAGNCNPPVDMSSLPPVRNVDDFRPDVDDCIQEGFLDDVPEEGKSDKNSDFRVLESANNRGGRNSNLPHDSDEDALDAINPLVASFQDNLDSSDEEASKPSKRRPDSLVGMALSSGDEDAATYLTNGLEKEGGDDRTAAAAAGDDDDDVVQLNGKDPSKAGQPQQSPIIFHTLNALDFDALEEKYIKKGPKDASIVDGFSTSTDDDASKVKKKKHRSKETQNSEEAKKKSEKSKKSKHHKDKVESTEDSEKRKKKRNKKQEDDDFEKFLESSTYESL